MKNTSQNMILPSWKEWQLTGFWERNQLTLIVKEMFELIAFVALLFHVEEIYLIQNWCCALGSRGVKVEQTLVYWFAVVLIICQVPN